MVAADHSDWDLQLPLVLAAYRASVHSTTGATPNLMMLGRETSAPLSLVYPGEGAAVGEGVQGYVARLQRDMARAHEFARREIGVAVERQTRNYDRGATDRTIPLQSVVYYHHPLRKKGLSPKLQRLWTGPWVVRQKIGECVYEIEQGRKRKVVHFNALKVVPPHPSKGFHRSALSASRDWWCWPVRRRRRHRRRRRPLP